MNTLRISDLAATEELDRQTMRAMRGGMTTGYIMPAMPQFPFAFPSLSQLTISPTQLISQTLNIENAVGTNSAFDTGMGGKVTPHQSANNSITLV
jgi:hypothetical protein